MNKPFTAQLNAIPFCYKQRITQHAYEEAVRLFEATHSVGLSESVWEFL